MLAASPLFRILSFTSFLEPPKKSAGVLLSPLLLRLN